MVEAMNISMLKAFVQIIARDIWRNVLLPVYPYLLMAIGFLLLSFAVGASVSTAVAGMTSSLSALDIFVYVTLGAMILGAIAGIGIISYVVLIVLTDYLMIVWRDARKKTEGKQE